MSNTCQALIEITQGSRIKYEWDHDLKILQVVRTLPASFTFPTNYGFIPKTLAADEDELDIFVFASAPIIAPSLVTAQVVGVLEMTDKGVRDDKVIAFMKGDKSWPYTQDIKEWPGEVAQKLLNDLHFFYREVKRLENKSFEFLGLKSADVAMDLIKSTGLNYQEKAIRS